MKEQFGTQRELIKVMIVATALSFGALGAFLFSFVDIRKDPTLEFSYRTVVAFVVGAFLGWVFWWVVLKIAAKKTKDRGGSK